MIFLQQFLFLLMMGAQVGPDQHSVTLTWVDTRNPTGTTYTAWRTPGLCSGGNLTFAKIATGITQKTYLDTPVAPGNYCYQITALFSNMESAPSPTAAAVVPSFPPTNLSAVAQ